MTTTITTTDIPNVLSELEEAFYDIPFENSNFQTNMFVIAAQQTPARAYRAIGLRMFAKIRAIKDLGFSRRIEEINLAEKQALIENDTTSAFDKMRARVEIDKIHDQRSWTDKLLNDALNELGCLYTEFKKLPPYTREQFEAEERLHFQMKLERQAKGQTGALEALANMNTDMTMLEHISSNPEALLHLQQQIDQTLNKRTTELLSDMMLKLK